MDSREEYLRKLKEINEEHERRLAEINQEYVNAKQKIDGSFSRLLVGAVFLCVVLPVIIVGLSILGKWLFGLVDGH